ncbi:MAG: type II secretion system major pseudopilin GspG [Xanthomonadales bacterium]|nr:type II secretion system major pseudopilin GspG [Xanthomonadales bacterium]
MKHNKSLYKIKPTPSQQGFSLIEILVVLVLIGLLAGFLVPNITSKFGAGQQKAAMGQVERLKQSVEEYNFLWNNRYPESLNDLIKPLPGQKEGMVKSSLLKDPWGRPYQYEYPGQHGEYDIYSYGADGQPGGEGKNADINSWE